MNQPRNNHDFNPYESTQQTPPQDEQPETPAGATQAHGSQAGGNAGMSPNDPAHSATSQSPQPDTAASPVQAPGNADPAAVPQTAQQPSVYAAPQAPYTQPSYGAPQPPANPYAAVAPKPAKKWPWVLLGCALAFLMGLGGCVGFATVGMVADSLHSRADGVHSYDFDDLPYGYDPDDLPDSDYYGGFTLSDI